LARAGYSIDPEAKDYLLVLVDFVFKISEKAIKEGNANCSSEA